VAVVAAAAAVAAVVVAAVVVVAVVVAAVVAVAVVALVMAPPSQRCSHSVSTKRTTLLRCRAARCTRRPT
jgi:hypothetical protein